MSTVQPPDPPSKEDPIDKTIFAGMKFTNPMFFLAWCRSHVHCDECGRIGAIMLRDRTFVCQTCLELLNSSI